MTNNERTAIANITTYNYSTNYSIYDAYERPSRKKVNAWDYCKKLCEKYKGSNLKVVSFNTFIFTAGFTFTDPETKEEMYMHITPTYNTPVLYR